ncbi:tumor necrosis factor receptor superfamily member 1B [Parambassis ranga]|uniref:Tumor necrosis factor receptor superfamily member 1B n=1 Tax=Parambassis ranga TaxID=210632 RepID=A0A6P7IDG8_9TELE|nr:tumor necrosis factor receptor superfamily member 1B-like [Parambassis ranga]
MKDIFVLLVLLTAQATKVCSLPYEADSGGNCYDTTKEYLLDGTNLCCKKCPPGQRLKQKCTETTETVCEPCEAGLYLESWNYSPNCFRCRKCLSKKGLQYAQNCSSTTRSICECNPGRYCVVDCTECKKYKQCKAGYGVSQQGTAKSDVKCEPCENGSFSDTASYTDSCKPHTICNRRAVIRKGNATSDTVCEPLTSTKPDSKTVFTSTSTAATNPNLTTPPTDSIHSIRPPLLEDASSLPTTLQSTMEPYSQLVFAVVPCVTGALLLFIIPVLVFLCRRSRRNDPVPSKFDANGNCESADKISQESQLALYRSTEQQYLLEKGEASSDHSQSSNTTETRMEACSSHESTSQCASALSEPLPLLSNTEPAPPSIVRQSSSQPTSIISPVTTSPHVNVNITLHIGNGSCGTPTVVPADFLPAGNQLPFGEAEECFCSPQQEDGKRSVMSVEESAIYSNEDFLSQTLRAT